MRKLICCLFLVWFAVAISPSDALASCFVAEEGAPPLSTTAQSIQSLNRQFDSPARRLAPGAKLSSDERRLLTGRLQLLEELIRTHPEEARAVLMDRARAAAMVAADATAAPLLEQDTDQTGEIVQTVADEFEHHTSTPHFYLHMVTGEIELFPTHALELSRYLHQRVSVKGVSTRAVMALESVGPASLPIGGEGEASPPIAADTIGFCPTTGVQKTAVILLKFPDATLTYPAGTDSASYWQQEVAGGRRTLRCRITGLRLPMARLLRRRMCLGRLLCLRPTIARRRPRC